MAKRTDGNHAAIMRALRQVGAFVTDLSMVGKGCPDILVGYRGVWYLIEIKDGSKPPSKRQLTEAEREWWDEAWYRAEIPLLKVESVEDALHYIGATT